MKEIIEVVIQDNIWYMKDQIKTGLALSFSRKHVEDMSDILMQYKDPLNQYGIYLLVNENQIYVGQTKTILKRLKQHLTKPWWDSVFIMTDHTGKIKRHHAEFLEQELYNLIRQNNHYVCMNRIKPGGSDVDPTDLYYLNEILKFTEITTQMVGIHIPPKEKDTEGLEEYTKVYAHYDDLVAEGFYLDGRIILPKGTPIYHVKPHKPFYTHQKVDEMRIVLTQEGYIKQGFLTERIEVSVSQAYPIIFGVLGGSSNTLWKDSNGRNVLEI